MIRKSLVIAVSAALTLSSAQAAMLTNIQGGVTVNAGAGYQPVAGPATVVPGERIRAADGSADIVYENGCTVHVAPNQVVLVNAAAPECSGAVYPGGYKEPAVEPGIPTEYLVAGAVIVGGGIACGILCEGEKHPASP